MSGVLRLSNTGTGTGRSTLSSEATDDQTYALPAVGGTFITGGPSSELIFPSGTEALPGLHVLSDLNTGLYAPAADTIAITTSGTEALRIDSSGRLLVGTSTARAVGGGTNSLAQIETTSENGLSFVAHRGTNSSGSILILGKSRGATVGSNTVVASGDELGALRFAGADGTDLQSRGGEISCEVDGTPGSNDMPGRLLFKTSADGASSPTERLRIDSSGNVGIGTTSPVKNLHIKNAGFCGIGIQSDRTSSSQNLGGLSFLNSSGTAVADILSTVDGQIYFSNASSEAMRIDSSGNVGIGTTSPSSPLHVNNGGSSACRFILQNTGSGSDDSTQIWSQNNDLAFNTNDSERLRIDSSGRLLVGTSSSVSFNGTPSAIQVQGDVDSETRISIRRTANDNGSGVLVFGKSRSSAHAVLQNNDTIGKIEWYGADGSDTNQRAAMLAVEVDGTPGSNDMPGRLVFSTTADGAASPTERMKITNGGSVLVGTSSNTSGGSGGNFAFVAQCFTNEENRPIAAFRRATYVSAQIFGSNGGDGNSANCIMRIRGHSSGNRSINAGGSVNATGADYAEYMTKDGEFIIAKGDICGVTFDGKLTNNFADAISFVVKSTNPSYIGNDVWGIDVENEKQREVARQMVDRIAFAGQVPVNVTGATPGQYIVPIQDDGGISGIAKDETDLTLIEYMRAVGKVIAIEDDGRARIIVKVA